MKRRDLLAGGAAFTLAGCERDASTALPPVAWVGANALRGHRLRKGSELPVPAVQRHAGALVIGGGIAGLAAARGFLRAGIDDVHLLELEDSPGGNSRGAVLGGMACPLGAHYLPLPAPESREVGEWLHELGLLRTSLGRTVADERHLCHSPQERLFFEGQWHDGLLPPLEGRAIVQTQRFAQFVAGWQRPRAFAIPSHRGPWSAELDALNRTRFDHWLTQQSLDDAHLLGYLDYCCRDDYGAGINTVSAWAGLHYFASRHGFHAPGDAEAERDAVFTWPEGNAWLVQRLAAPLGERLHGGRTVLRVREERHAVQVLAWNEAKQQLEAWAAPQVVLAMPLFITARVLEAPPPALREAASMLSYAPWLVANLQLDAPPVDRPGAPPAWDNVIHGSRGLGYVDAMHQSLRPHAGATVLSAYHALPISERATLLADDQRPWAERVLQDLELAHPDIRRHVQRIELARWGHAMAIPAPGVHRHPALQALRAQRGRVRFAHADLAGYSIFEEAFTTGIEAAAHDPARRM